MGKSQYAERKRIKVIYSLIAIAIVLFGVWLWMKSEKEKFYDDFDAARDEYREDIEAADLYEKKDGDYVVKIDIVDSFDDDNLSNMWFHTNLDEVTVTMDDYIDTFPVKERCSQFVEIMNELGPRIDEYYENSRYKKIFNENMGYATMQYRGISLQIYHKREFTFKTSANTYSFKYINSMAQTDKKTGHNTYYDYSEHDGELVKFENKYGSKSKSSTSGSKSNSATGKSTYKSAGSSKSKKKYDPYDVYEYKTAQDFADDKYEEFYDYEDDYGDDDPVEDEDEAYDAAEDYWKAHH